MIYGSVCSGIEAATAAWHPLGWKAAWYSEIEPFPCAILKRHYPDVPNLGDMTKIHDSEVFRGANLDVLVGGTPCQSFSIAGLRKGLADPRGNLTLTFLQMVAAKMPPWVVWENVPGILSEKTGALTALISGFNKLGYAVECDILDAQCFGVPQRRRRIFLLCHSVNHGRKNRTPLFISTTAKMLTESLLSVLAAVCAPSSIGAQNSAWPRSLSKDGLRMKMELFGLLRVKQGSEIICTNALESLLNDWDDALAKCLLVHESSALILEPSSAETEMSADTPLTDAKTDVGSSFTGKSWRNISDAMSFLLSESTTSTLLKPKMESAIYSCAQALLNIAASMYKLSCCYPNSCDGDSCGLTALRGFIRYARQADSDLFRQQRGVCDWHGFVQSAEKVERLLVRSLGDRVRSEQILLIGESVPRNIEASGEAGQGFTRDVGRSLKASGGFKGAKDHEPLIAHSLRGEGFDASEDGTGRGTPIIPILEAGARVGTSQNDPRAGMGIGKPGDPMFTLQSGKQHAIAFGSKDSGQDALEDISPTLRAGGHNDSHQNGGVPPAVCYDMRGDGDNVPTLTGHHAGAISDFSPMVFESRIARNGRGGLSDVVPPLKAESGVSGKGDGAPLVFQQNSRSEVREMGDRTGAVTSEPGTQCQNYLKSGTAVRRLTPRECERLQGLPDDYTLVAWRGKPQEKCPDGPRYKAIGNSMAVPVMNFIGKRIQMVEEILNGAE